MKSFLKEQAGEIYNTYPRLDLLTIVFPNRRAILYFKKHLSDLLAKPVFSPRLLTIEDFIKSFSSYAVPDKLELIHRLHSVYADITTIKEPFEKFFFWGEMLLKDFDEIDKYCVDAEQLFKDLSQLKELDSSFDFLTEEQLEFLKSFWGSFDKNLNQNKRRFLEVWKELALVYKNLKTELQKDGLAYEGMVHREVAKRLEQNEIKTSFEKDSLIFIGFNALTKAEEIIIAHFVDQQTAKVIWDIDEYYVNSDRQEAGDFFRAYQNHPSLSKTFPSDIPANFRTEKSIKVYGAPQLVGQAKLTAQLLRDELLKGVEVEDTLIVLPDERVLFPVLHGISDEVERLNVSMGFPLSNTPMFNLVELLIEMQINARNDQFNHRQVIGFLAHPYGVAADPGIAQKLSKEIIHANWVSIDGEFLRREHALYNLVFTEVESGAVTAYLREITIYIGSLEDISPFDKEYAFHFVTLLNRLGEVLNVTEKETNSSRRELFQSFLRLFRQLVRGSRIPFVGEPLKGLQVMGVLETRNLDFKNVFILSLNEGVFPSVASSGSYIPFNIRRAYKLPTVEHQDAIYAYLFYRVLQRAENIYLIYNSETDILGQGEMSRYLQQLIYELKKPIERNILHTPVKPNAIEPITIIKDERVFNKLALYCKGERLAKGLSPTAINDYIECRLRFYFKYVASIKEPREIQEDLDARVLGNMLHEVMQLFYEQITESNQTNIIKTQDLADWEKRIEPIIDQVFRTSYGIKTKKVEYIGQRLVVREVIKSFVARIVEMDKVYAPFKIEALEADELQVSVRLNAVGNPEVVLGGKVDRVDSKDGVLRVIDYKTGKDEVDIKGNLSDLFSHEANRNKAAFQTMMYSLLYTENNETGNLRVVPGLMNRMNLFDQNFQFGLKVGKEYVEDIQSLLPEFMDGLKDTLEEMYNAEIPFDQTTNVENCKNCPYKGICYR